MAQAIYVPNLIGAPITDAHRKASTNPYIDWGVCVLSQGGAL